MKAWTARLLALGALLAGPVAIYIMFRPRPEARSELRSLDASIALGSSAELAMQRCQEANFKHVRCIVVAQGMLATTPYELGATNWFLYIDVRTGRVVGKRYRLADDEALRANDAPPDQVSHEPQVALSGDATNGPR